MEIDSKIKSAFDLVLKLQPDRPRLLTPIPQSFIPFWEHSYNVLKNVLQMGFSEEETILASILHDVLEDIQKDIELSRRMKSVQGNSEKDSKRAVRK